MLAFKVTGVRSFASKTRQQTICLDLKIILKYYRLWVEGSPTKRYWISSKNFNLYFWIIKLVFLRNSAFTINKRFMVAISSQEFLMIKFFKLTRIRKSIKQNGQTEETTH